ncbi:MAG: hypothetical protein ABSH50_19095 [Bryobacteraceae bacterium]|jgi:hypothetical protein
MTAPTPKPESPPKPRLPRPVALGIAALLAFTAFAVALMRLLPSPHATSDYLVVGTLATLAALITVFAGLVLSRRR